MPDETLRYSIPFPLPADAVTDYPGVGLDLAETLDALLARSANISVGADPPANPVDGELWALPVRQDGAAGVADAVWLFRFNAASPRYQWEFAGGAPMLSMVVASETFNANNNWVNALTRGPSVIVPRLGDYEWSFAAYLIGANGFAFAAGKVGARLSNGDNPATPAGSGVTMYAGAVPTQGASLAAQGVLLGLPAAKELLLQYQHSGTSNNPQAGFRSVRVMPVRVSHDPVLDRERVPSPPAIELDE